MTIREEYRLGVFDSRMLSGILEPKEGGNDRKFDKAA
jgi:hypothetical protein